MPLKIMLFKNKNKLKEHIKNTNKFQKMIITKNDKFKFFISK